MDWSDPAVQFGTQSLNNALRDFTHSTLCSTRSKALELLGRLRASRVTLDYLRQVSAADIVSGKGAASEERKSPVSVMTPLDDKATTKVKGYLRRRVEKLKTSDGEAFRKLVPQERSAFEQGFDAFLENCMAKSTNLKNSWFEEHVSSGAAQPQLWKIYVAFQRQLREACEAESRKPLPPPLFMAKEDDVASMPLPRRRTLSQSPTVGGVPFGPGHATQYSHSPGSHLRTQSCGEAGSYPHQMYPYGYQSFANVPYVMMSSPYHARHASYPGYQHGRQSDPHRDYTEQWIAGLGIQDDADLFYFSHENAMLPAGVQFVSPRMYTGGYTAYSMRH